MLGMKTLVVQEMGEGTQQRPLSTNTNLSYLFY